MPLAYGLNHRDQALRYAVKLAERDSSDGVLLRRIGSYLAEESQWKQAGVFLEKALAIERAAGKTTLARLQLELELARVYFFTERYADAAPLFDELRSALDKPADLKLDSEARRTLLGEEGLTYELMGASYLEVNRPQDALAAFKKLNDIEHKPGTLALNTARVDAQAGRPEEALSQLQTYFDSKPKDLALSALDLLTKQLQGLKQADQVLPRLAKLRSSLGGSPALDYFEAEQLRQAGKLAEAIPLYEAVLKKKPAAEVYRALADLYRRTDRREPLLNLLGDVAAKTESFDVLEAEGKTILADDKLCHALIDAARKDHAKGAEADYPALLAAATLAAERKQFDAAAEFYNLAIKAQPKEKGSLLLRWGLALLAAEKYDEAGKVFQRGIDEKALPPDKPLFEYLLAGVLEMSGKTDDALAMARKAALPPDKDKPAEARFAARPAWILYHAKRYDEADKAYREFLAKYDDDYSGDDTRDSVREARSVLSNIATIRHKLPEAEEWLQQVLDETPDDVGALNDLGYLWADQNKHLARSLAMIQQAVAAEPKNAAYRDSLGWIFFRLGRTAEAVAELKKAIAGDKEPDPTIYEHLGDVLAADHQSQEALKQWQRALAGYEKDKDADHLKTIRQKIDSTPRR